LGGNESRRRVYTALRAIAELILTGGWRDFEPGGRYASVLVRSIHIFDFHRLKPYIRYTVQYYRTNAGIHRGGSRMKKILFIIVLFVSFIVPPGLATAQVTKEKKAKTIQNTEKKTKAKKPHSGSAGVQKEISTKTEGEAPAVLEKEKSKKEKEEAPAIVKPSKNSGQKSQAGDKVIGTDEKGRTMYEGPRGGRYYINDAGNKVYIKDKEKEKEKK
jgi:hypothetical protein